MQAAIMVTTQWGRSLGSQDDPPNVALLMMVTSEGRGGDKAKAYYGCCSGASPVKSDLKNSKFSCPTPAIQHGSRGCKNLIMWLQAAKTTKIILVPITPIH